jgi:outer membrane receptor for ferrienterochelin and colicins
MSLLYKITPNLRIRAGYAKGYRAPQVFNEDLHYELINAKKVQTINSENLIQETSHSFTSSVNTDFVIGNSPSFFLVDGFYTRLSNPFADEFYDPNNDGNFVYLRVNAKDGAYVTGANFEFKTFITPKLESQLGFTIQKSAYEAAQAWGEEESSVSKDSCVRQTIMVMLHLTGNRPSILTQTCRLTTPDRCGCPISDFPSRNMMTQ